jgi:sulfoxide reductase heme-binding subunit YedZ
MVRRLGGQRWRRLHRAAYLAGLLAVLHYAWLVKADLSEPLLYAGLLGLGLLLRRLPARGPRAAPVVTQP